MFDNERALASIEAAEHDTPFCICGSPTVPVGHGQSVWLECATVGRDRSLLRRLLSLDLAVGHTRRLIVDLSEHDDTGFVQAA